MADKVTQEEMGHGTKISTDEVDRINQDIKEMLKDFQEHKISIKAVSQFTISCFGKILQR